MATFLEEEEVKLHERRLKERMTIQGLEVHGKSKEKEYKMMASNYQSGRRWDHGSAPVITGTL